MPTELGPAYSPRYRGVPTGMSAEDLRIWFRYQDTIPTDAIALYFNVRLGQGKPLPDPSLSEWQTYWYQVTAKRADVLLQLPDQIKIVELRNNANANALGRLTMYRTLWTDDPKLPGTVTAELVTNLEDPDVKRQAEALQITYTVV